MAISKKAIEITDRIYQAYGTHSGILFGIPSSCRSAVEAVVSSALEFDKDYVAISDDLIRKEEE